MANRIKGIIVEIGGDTTKQLQNGEISQEQYDALQREIAETEVFNNSRCHTINRYFVQTVFPCSWANTSSAALCPISCRSGLALARGGV